MISGKNSVNILFAAEQNRHTKKCLIELESKFRVIPAISVRDGLTAFLEEKIDSVVIDSSISNMSGISLFQKIRHVAKYTPTYYVCDTISFEDLESCASLGISGFFRKPVNPRELAEKIDGDIRQKLSDNLVTLLRMEYPFVAKTIHPKVRVALKIINDNYFRPLKKEFFINQLEISSEYLSRIFSKDCGMTIPQYVRRLRIEKAKELLANTVMNSGEIAAMLGFANSNYFYVLFRELTGSSPIEFRKKSTH